MASGQLLKPSSNKGDKQDMNTDKTVRLRPNYLLERIDGEITVYHPTLTTSIYLNQTGALIWELCDGKKTIPDIVTILAGLYPESREQIDQDVRNVIRKLIDRKVADLI